MSTTPEEFGDPDANDADGFPDDLPDAEPGDEVPTPTRSEG